MVAEQADGVDEQVVEVHRPGLVQAVLVLAVHVGVLAVEDVLGPRGDLVGVEELVLPQADQAVHAARREALGVEVEVADHVPGEAHGVGLVVDRELARVAEPVGVGPQHAHARRVERADPHRAGDRADERGDALAHLVGGLVGERDGEDPRGVHALVDEVGDAVREHPGLAGAGAGDDEQRAAAVDDGVELVGVEAVGRRVDVGEGAASEWPASGASGMSRPSYGGGARPTGIAVRRIRDGTQVRSSSAHDGDGAVGVGQHLERRRAGDQLDEPGPPTRADDDEVGVAGRLDHGEGAGPGGHDRHDLGAVRRARRSRRWRRRSRGAAGSRRRRSPRSDSSPGSTTGPAATPGTKSAWATSTRATPGQRAAPTAARPSSGRRARSSCSSAQSTPTTTVAHREAQLTAHDDDRPLGVAHDVVGGRAEQQRGLARAAVADDHDDVRTELFGGLDERPPGGTVGDPAVDAAGRVLADHVADERRRERPSTSVGVDRRAGLVAGHDRERPRRGRRRRDRRRAPRRAPTTGRRGRGPRRRGRRGRWSSRPTLPAVPPCCPPRHLPFTPNGRQARTPRVCSRHRRRRQRGQP